MVERPGTSTKKIIPFAPTPKEEAATGGDPVENKGDGLFSTRLVWQRKKYENDSDMAAIATKIKAAYELVR